MAQAEGLGSVERLPVPDGQVAWDVECPGYNPQFIDMPRGGTRFRKEGDRPDPADPRAVERNYTSLEPTVPSYHVADYLRNPTGETADTIGYRGDEYGGYAVNERPSWARVPYEGHYVVDVDEHGLPLNPRGRTGLSGRFMLDKWGETEAADPILTRTNPESGDWEVLLVQRKDTGEWALPGGKVDEGETAAQAAGRELHEEAGISGVELDFSDDPVIYAGYADDSRNSDNAWMGTTVIHKHLDPAQSAAVQVQAGSDAAAARWVRMGEVLAPDARVFSAHGKYLELIAQGN